MMFLIIGKQCLFPSVSSAQVDEDGCLKEIGIEWGKTPTMIYDDEGKCREQIRRLKEMSGKEFYIVAMRDHYDYEIFLQTSTIFYEAFARKYDKRAKKEKTKLIIRIDENKGESIYPYIMNMGAYPWTRYVNEAKPYGMHIHTFHFENDEDTLRLLERIKRDGFIH